MRNKAFLVLGLILAISLFGLVGAETNCTVKEDCYPLNFTPSDCGNFYTCVNSTCSMGSNSCANETDDSRNETEDDDNDLNETDDDEDNETDRDNGRGQDCSNIKLAAKCMLRTDCSFNMTLENARMQPQERERAKERIKERVMNYLNSTECPENCTCTGSVVKCWTENGREMTVIAGKSGNVIFQVKGINASTKVILIKNETGIYANLSGKVKELKYTPDQIREMVMKRLKIEECKNCNITLKENGEYEMQIENKYRILGIFSRKIISVSRVDSESGEITYTKIKKPWWKFMAFKSD